MGPFFFHLNEMAKRGQALDESLLQDNHWDRNSPINIYPPAHWQRVVMGNPSEEFSGLELPRPPLWALLPSADVTSSFVNSAR